MKESVPALGSETSSVYSCKGEVLVGHVLRVPVLHDGVGREENAGSELRVVDGVAG